VRTSPRTSPQLDHLGGGAIQVLVEQGGVVAELPGELVPVAVTHSGRRVAGVPVGAWAAAYVREAAEAAEAADAAAPPPDMSSVIGDCLSNFHVDLLDL
jgi:hypothetical protein